MHVLIIGGGGFIGSRLARELMESGGLAGGEVDRLMLLDIAFPAEILQEPAFKCIEADFSDPAVIESVLEHQPDLIFHLAAVVSGEAEKNLDQGMKVNFHASLQLLEYCRKLAFHPRIVFASSCAVFGGDVSKTIHNDTAPKPRSSYGTQKAMVELLMNDYSRKGFVDARCLRLPTIAVRPGKPNAATSSFVSGMIREPLNGINTSCPVPSDTKLWIQSPNCVIQNFIHAANIDEKLLGGDRIINLPGLTASVQDMISSLERMAGPGVTGLISYEPDEFIQSIVLTWPPHFDTLRADQLGFVKDTSTDEVVRDYIEEIQQ